MWRPKSFSLGLNDIFPDDIAISWDLESRRALKQGEDVIKDLLVRRREIAFQEIDHIRNVLMNSKEQEYKLLKIKWRLEDFLDDVESDLQHLKDGDHLKNFY
jgi:hypothetical protein